VTAWRGSGRRGGDGAGETCAPTRRRGLTSGDEERARREEAAPSPANEDTRAVYQACSESVKQIPARIGPAEFRTLGALIAVRCPSDAAEV
jgi:hypothetical protein